MKTEIQNLETDGFVKISYPQDLRQGVEKAIDYWKQFCSLPDEIKKKFPYSNTSAGVGYEMKESTTATQDQKENFDLTIDGVSWLQEASEELNNETISSFTKHAEDLIRLMRPLVFNFAENIENTFGLVGFKSEVVDSEDNWFIRFIHYPGGRKKGDEIATPHTDQSGFTLHLYESDAGLQRLDFNKVWRHMPVSEGETVVIPDMQLQIRSSNVLKATCHRVVATTETAINGRFSAVCFIKLKNTPSYNKTVAGRLQERQPGFNYDIPFDEFSRMFT